MVTLGFKLKASGLTVYGQILNSSGKIWNTTGTPNFETPLNTPGNYSVTLTEATLPYLYFINWPSTANMVAGYYQLIIMKQVGGSPSQTTDIQIGGGDIYFDGTSISFQTGDSYARLGVPAGASIAADIAEIEAETDTITISSSGVTTLLTRIPGTIQPQTGDAYSVVNDSVFGNAHLVRSTTPANTLTVDSSGEANALVTNYASGMSPKSQVINLVVPGESGLTFGQLLYMSFLQTGGEFGTPVRTITAPYTITVPFIRSVDGVTVFTYVTTYTDNTFSKTLSRTYSTNNLPAP